MATANAMSSSCQSIAAVTNMSTSVGGGGGCLRSNSGNGNTQYVMGTGSLGRLKLKTLGASDEELDFAQLSQSTHILGRVKSDRFLSSKVDEDRRRRTIIVEKKNDSFGFTLQSYGIHYKKDQEVEMITYVDYVEYDGPAYKAGMREGDVILSINGQNMEKADHKTLVDFIKSCDSRMRMVVLFEDCVRKVNLHMRYIQLQTLLQNKMNELERICVRERELLEGKWKTHSLPARKKATTATEGGTETGNSPTDTEINLPYYRPALSTEDFTNIARQSSQQTIIPPPAQYMLSYQYFDPTYRYVLKPSISTTSSGDCFVTIGEPLSRAQSGDTTTAGPTSQHFTSQRRSSVSQTPPAPPPRTCEKHKPPNKQQQQQQSTPPKQQDTSSGAVAGAHKSSKAGKHCHGRSCNPCIDFRWKSSAKTAALATSGNGDNVSLDAYDLASPCCDTQCVPTRRHVRHHHKEHGHKHKHRDRERESESKERPPRPKSQSHVSPGPATRHHHHHHHVAHDPSHHHVTQHYQYYGSGQQQQQQQQSLASQHQKSGHGCDSQSGSIRSRYFDLASGLASHCSLHSCTSSEFQQPDTASYTTSISTDTLFYDPNSENPGMTSRQHSTKSRQSTCQQQAHQQHQHQHHHHQPQQQQQQQQAEQQSGGPHHHHHHHQQQQHQHQHHSQHHHHQQQQQQHQAQYMQHMYQQRYHITATQIQPAQIFPNTAYVHKPKSWDNLTAANLGAYGYGYGYLDTVAMKPIVNLQIAQQRHSIPRKNPYGRYSAYTDVENYAPPPTEFLEQVTTTTTTITAKSAEDILASPGTGPTPNPCECSTSQQHQQAIKMAQMQINQGHAGHHQQCQMGYYSHLPQPKTDAATSTAGSPQTANSATVTEVTRL
ncbi:PDZ domain-containing short spindle 6 [Musca autumnalis]|uniref:PDZ domain-containing short spindle 6 n=1 Tax=Musca autumnalis TaxID=221902 RepID=UPI003CF22F0A